MVRIIIYTQYEIKLTWHNQCDSFSLLGKHLDGNDMVYAIFCYFKDAECILVWLRSANKPISLSNEVLKKWNRLRKHYQLFVHFHKYNLKKKPNPKTHNFKIRWVFSRFHPPAKQIKCFCVQTELVQLQSSTCAQFWPLIEPCCQCTYVKGPLTQHAYTKLLSSKYRKA